jgi:hypothetical protein
MVFARVPADSPHDLDKQPAYEQRGEYQNCRPGIFSEMRHGIKNAAIVAADHLAGVRRIRVDIAAGPTPNEGHCHEHQKRDKAKQNKKAHEYAKKAHRSCPSMFPSKSSRNVTSNGGRLVVFILLNPGD